MNRRDGLVVAFLGTFLGTVVVIPIAKNVRLTIYLVVALIGLALFVFGLLQVTNRLGYYSRYLIRNSAIPLLLSAALGACTYHGYLLAVGRATLICGPSGDCVERGAEVIFVLWVWLILWTILIRSVRPLRRLSFKRLYPQTQLSLEVFPIGRRSGELEGEPGNADDAPDHYVFQLKHKGGAAGPIFIEFLAFEEVGVRGATGRVWTASPTFRSKFLSVARSPSSKTVINIDGRLDSQIVSLVPNESLYLFIPIQGDDSSAFREHSRFGVAVYLRDGGVSRPDLELTEQHIRTLESALTL